MAARTLIVDSGGTTRRVLRMFVVDGGGVSRLIKRKFVIDGGGVARLVHVGEITATINNTFGYVRAGGNINLTWSNAGVFSSNDNAGGGVTPYNWLTAGAAADAQIFFHQLTGNPMTGVVLDTWLDLSTTRTISQTWPGGVSSSAYTLQVSIRDKNTLNVVAGPTTLSGGTSP